MLCLINEAYFLITIFISEKMNNSPSANQADEHALKEMYKTAIRASYFGGMHNQGFMQKSRVQLNNVAQ